MSQQSWTERARNDAFGVIHWLVERPAHHRVTTSTQLVTLVFLLVELVQVIALPLHPVFEWPSFILDLEHAVSFQHTIIGTSWSSFLIGFFAVVLAAWVQAAVLLHVRRVSANGGRVSRWLLSPLRVSTFMLSGPLVVPCTFVVFTPFSCAEMEMHLGEVECDDIRRWLMAAVALPTVLVATPTMLTLRLLKQDTDANAASISCKVGCGVV